MSAMESRATPPVAIYWIRNNIVAATVFCVAWFAIDGIDQAIGTDDPESESAAIQFAATIVFLAAAGIAYGFLSSAVLQRIIPQLSARMWIALQAALAVAINIESGSAASLATTAAAVGEEW